MLPFSSSARHSRGEGHASEAMLLVVSTALSVHVEASPVGCVEVKTLPSASTAMHSDTDGHERSRRLAGSLRWMSFHAPAPPARWVEDKVFPPSSKATHSFWSLPGPPRAQLYAGPRWRWVASPRAGRVPRSRRWRSAAYPRSCLRARRRRSPTTRRHSRRDLCQMKRRDTSHPAGTL